jgi:protein-disulfide isomerase
MQTEVLRAARLFALGAVLLSAGACAKEGTASEKAPAAASKNGNEFPDVLATVDGDKITMSEVRDRAGTELDRIDTQYYLIRSKIVEAVLDSMLRERTILAEAKKQKKSVDDLINAEAGQQLEPTDAQITAWYQANQDRAAGRTLESLRSQISDLLKNKNRKDAEDRLLARLNKERKVEVKFHPYRLAIDNGAAPARGNTNAPVTMVEFSDFQCPFCFRFAPVLNQVASKYGDKVRIVYRQYPLTSIHPFAFKAAEASLCAHEQGKFWEMHDALFADQNKLGVADMKQTAGRLGLDRKEFDKCLDTGRFTEQVQKDMAEGTRLGITGTPAVFVNGVEVPGGAVPVEKIAAAIDKELERLDSTK